MSATTDYIFPKWITKTPLFEMLVKAVDPNHAQLTDFYDEFEFNDASTEDPTYPYSFPRLGAKLESAYSESFESILKAIEIPYLRDFGRDLDSGEAEGYEFVSKETRIVWDGGEFVVTPQDVVDIVNGVAQSQRLVDAALSALNDRNTFNSILSQDDIPDGFSLEALPEKLAALDDYYLKHVAKEWRSIIDLNLQKDAEPESKPHKLKMTR